jgi:hypothetical protein
VQSPRQGLILAPAPLLIDQHALVTPVLVLSGTASAGMPPKCSKARTCIPSHDSICWSRVLSAKV